MKVEGELKKLMEKKYWTLHKAAEEGQVDVAKMLIQNGADVNAVDCVRKFTALHIAARYGHVDVAKVLIHYGADVRECCYEKESGSTSLRS